MIESDNELTAVEIEGIKHIIREMIEEQEGNEMAEGLEETGKQFVSAPAIDELGYDKAPDHIAVPNRFVDVREVTNLVRYVQYQVGNLAGVIEEDIAEGQAAAAMLTRATAGLAAQVSRLEKLSAKAKG